MKWRVLQNTRNDKSIYDIQLAALGYPELKSITSRLREDIEGMIENIIYVKTGNSWSLVFDDPSDVVKNERQPIT